MAILLKKEALILTKRNGSISILEQPMKLLNIKLPYLVIDSKIS